MFANAFSTWVDTEMTRRRFDESEMQTQTGLTREVIKQIRKGEKIPTPHEIGLFCRGLPRLKRMHGLINATKILHKESEEKKNVKPKVSIAIETPKKENAEIEKSNATLIEINTSPLNIKTTSNLQFSKIEEIDPSLATLLLTGNVRNRNISINHVEALARDMKNGKWYVTHQGIALDKDMRLLDGQHRLSAVVLSGVTVQMTVTYNADPESFRVVDTGIMPRSVAQIFDMAEKSEEPIVKTKNKVSSRSVAAVKIIHGMVTNEYRSKWTVADVAELMKKYPHVTECSGLGSYRVSGAIAGFGYALPIYPEICNDFMSKLSSLVGMNKIHSAYAKAIDRISGGFAGNVSIALITLRAIRMIHSGKTETKSMYVQDVKQDYSNNADFRHFRNAREKKGLAT